MTTKLKSPHPQWALTHRKAGTELRCIRGNYYLYEYKTVYDQVRKRPKKISGKLIGSITEKEGLIPSGKRVLERTLDAKVFNNVVCKEYGVSLMVKEKFSVYGKALHEAFGDLGKSILAIAYCRFLYRCPLKNIPFRLMQSFLPEMLELDSFNEKTSSSILKTVGGNHEQMLSYMKSFIRKGEYFLMDVTNVLSNSTQISLSKIGYNNSLSYDKQFNLMYLYTAGSHMPVYYRLLPGNIREVKAFKNCLIEAGLKKAIIVADKGFYSKKNIQLLQDEKLKYILPLKRDNEIIQYDAIIQNTFKQNDSFFEHENRIIWYRKYKVPGLTVFLNLDEGLRVKEESDYLRRIQTHPENYTLKQYHVKRHTFGTIALLTNINRSSAIDTYQTYKSRMSIEIMFDGMKNTLDADHTYMQDEQTLQGWMFVNHITLQWYQHLYVELKEKGLLKKISVNDYIYHLSDIKKIKINNSWHLNEFTSYTEKLLTRIGVVIPKYNT